MPLLTICGMRLMAVSGCLRCYRRLRVRRQLKADVGKFGEGGPSLVSETLVQTGLQGKAVPNYLQMLPLRWLRDAVLLIITSTLHHYYSSVMGTFTSLPR